MDFEEKLKKEFNIEKIKEVENLSLNDEYYLIKNKNNKLFIRTDFFVSQIFSKGSKWGENLFKELFNEEVESNDIVEQINVLSGYSIDIDNIDNAIIIETKAKFNKEIRKEKKLKQYPDKLIIRALKKRVSLEELNKIGSGTEFILSEDNKLEVEILDGKRVIAIGELKKLKDGYSLNIKEVVE